MGLNATERPGAVYLASVLAAHARKGLPAFGIYGRHVQEADDPEIPEDVKEKLLRFARASIAAASMRGKILFADWLHCVWGYPVPALTLIFLRNIWE